MAQSLLTPSKSTLNGAYSPVYSEWQIALIGLYAMAVTIGVGRFLYTATLPSIINELPLSTQAADVLASTNYLGYFLGALMSMFIPAAWTWRVLMYSLIASVMTTLALAIPLSVPLWFMMRLLSGIASSVGMIMASTYLFRYFSHDNRWALSTVHYMGIGIGIAASSLVTWGLFSLGMDYDKVWGACGLLSLPLVYFIFRLRPLSSTSSTPALAKRRDASKPLFNGAQLKHMWRDISGGHSSTIVLVCISYLLSGFGYVTSATFLPLMAEEALSDQPHIGLIIWMVVGICTALSNPLWGWVAKYVGAGQTLLGLMLLQALGMFLPLWLTGDYALIGLYANAVILGMTFIGIVSLTLILLKDINPSYANLLLGLGTVMYSTGQFVGPIVTVAISGPTGGFNPGLMAAGAALLVASALMLFVVITKERL